MKKLIYIDMDGVLCDFAGAVLESFINNPEIKFPQSQHGFFTALEPIKDSIEMVNRLTEHFDVYILTAPSVKNPLTCYEVCTYRHCTYNLPQCFSLRLLFSILRQSQLSLTPSNSP